MSTDPKSIAMAECVRFQRDYKRTQISPTDVAREWSRVSGDSLPAPVAFYLCDFAVEFGAKRAIIALQSANGLDCSGRMDSKTLDEAWVPNTLEFIHTCRLDFYKKQRMFNACHKIWNRRAEKALSISKSFDR